MSRLMVVDDLPEICDVIATYLREEGHEVATATHGAAARQALEGESYDALIVDLVLPGASGLTLAQLAAARGIPVLMISGKPMTIDTKDGQAPSLFLQKPFHLAELGSAVRDLLNGRAGPA